MRNNCFQNIPCDFCIAISWCRLWELVQKAIYFSIKKLSFDDCSIYYTNIAYPYTPRHIINANIVAGTSAQPQIEKMVEQIHLLSKEVIRLRGKFTVHPQPARDVPAHNLPPQPHRTPITRRCLNYVKGYGQNEEEPPKQRSHSLARECSHRPTVPLKSEHSHRVHTSHHGRERSHHSRCSMLDSSSSYDLHRERPRKRV